MVSDRKTRGGEKELQELCTLPEVAKAYGVSYYLLYEKVRKKKIRPLRRIGTANLYNLGDILQHFVFIDGRIYDLDEAKMVLSHSGGEIR